MIASAHVRANMVNTRANPSASFVDETSHASVVRNQNPDPNNNAQGTAIGGTTDVALAEASLVATPNATNDGQETVSMVDATSVPNTVESQVDTTGIPAVDTNTIREQVDARSVPSLNNENDNAMVDAHGVPAGQNESHTLLSENPCLLYTSPSPRDS